MFAGEKVIWAGDYRMTRRRKVKLNMRMMGVSGGGGGEKIH